MLCKLKYSYLELLESNEGLLPQSFRQNSILSLRIHPCLFQDDHNLPFFSDRCHDICGLLRGKKVSRGKKLTFL